MATRMRVWTMDHHRTLCRTDPLVVLLLLDLVHLLHQLPDSQLQLRQLVFGRDLGVVVGVFPHLDVQVNPLQHNQEAILLDDVLTALLSEHEYWLKVSPVPSLGVSSALGRVLTSMPPANRANLEELEWRQI
ncbi:hypothetical protein EYF80_017837 [Liparis tanakae]|uniref:Secreted protein n=1 Tax=Liparis tanakae TaxID=230148 RepID=A0A4Z2I1T8_9TELE|nr:hypothetical protein EYF80_017837 [Liparis tanakae]